MSITALGVTAITLAGCSGGAGGSSGPAEFTFLSANENTATRDVLTALSEEECAAENKALPLKVTTEPQATLDQKVSLLAGQDALPSLFQAGQTATIKELAEAGKIQDLDKAFADLDVSDAILPAAKDSITGQLGGLYTLPAELNIEGFWYNKALFEANGIQVPETWTDFTAAAEKLKAAGIQPLAAAGKDGWPITRLIGNYIYRSLGPDSLEAVASGDAELTDPEYVAAAQAVADLGSAGYFGDGVSEVDYGTAANTFLSGDAAAFYMGSWALAAFNDPEQNLIGEENIGFFPFPAVEGGAGSADQMPVNTGIATVVSAKNYDDKTGAWVKCIAQNFGAKSLQLNGVITGFAVNGDVELPPLTEEVQSTIDNSTSTVLFYEALFSPAASQNGLAEIGPLLTGQLTAEQFMADTQSKLGS